MQYFLKALHSSSFDLRKSRKSSAVRALAACLMIFCFVFSMPAQPVQAFLADRAVPASRTTDQTDQDDVVVDDSDSEPTGNNRTTMYVSSALAGRHGLCVLLESVDSAGNKKYGLIDTGNPNIPAAREFLNKHGVTTLEFMILTHMHKDHVGNAVWILKNYRVKQLYLKQFDATWSNGQQGIYENILRAAVTSPYVNQIHGVSYALSKNKIASPKASKSFVTFLQTHAKKKWRFKGLFNGSNTALYLGSASIRLYNWEIWSEDGKTKWVPGKTTRCKARKFAPDNSDNHFSMGVRVTRGSKKIWIGGDITNLRLQNMRHSGWQGDEDRIGKSIGRVNVAVLNHHGNAGSNSKSFLRAISPSYVIYTSAKADVNVSGSQALSTLNYIRRTMKLPESHILWAFDKYSTHCKDPVVTLSANTVEASGQIIADKAGTVKSNNLSRNKGLSVSLVPGHTYTNYDLTGDGKKDIISISGNKGAGSQQGLSISVNKEVVWSTKVTFKDARPVSLLRLPGKQPYICISILKPAAANGKGKVLCLYKYGKKTAAGKKYGLVAAYNMLKKMPVNKFNYSNVSTISCDAKRITIVAAGSDTLSNKAFVSFVLEQGKNGLQTIDTVFPYTNVKGQTGSITLGASTKAFSSANAGKKSSTLSKGKKVAVTGVVKNKAGVTRYRINVKKKVLWINAPAQK